MENNWPTKKLGELTNIYSGGTPSRSIPEFWENDVPWLTMEDVNKTFNVIGTVQYISQKGLQSSNAQLIPSNSVNLSCTASIGNVTINRIPLTTNQQFNSFHPKDKNELIPEFLAYRLIYDREKIKSLGEKTTFPFISKTKISNFEISYPPIQEQKKIVGKIEKLFAKIDGAKKFRFEAISASESILPSAMYQVFSRAEKENWQVRKIRGITKEIKSGFACAKTNQVDNGVVHLRTNNISIDGKLDLSVITKIPKKFVNSKIYSLKKGDVIFNNTNSVELVGKTTVIEEDLPYVFSNHLTRIRVDETKSIPEYVTIMFKKLWQEGFFVRLCTQWVNQAGINQTKLENIEIPLPSIAEQRKIVSYLDSLSKKTQELVNYQKSQLKDLEELKQSILDKAFKGELI